MTVKIILYIATSLDGFIATKDGSVKWLDKYNELGEDLGYNEFVKSINAVILGNTTYEQILSFDCDYPYKNQKSYVFANNEYKDDNVTFVNEDVKKFIEGLDKKKDHKIWLVGGANIVNQFLEHDLIDEFKIFVMPEILGRGIRLFSKENSDKLLVLKDSKSFKSGIVELNYKKKA